MTHDEYTRLIHETVGELLAIDAEAQEKGMIREWFVPADDADKPYIYNIINRFNASIVALRAMRNSFHAEAVGGDSQGTP